MRKAGLRIIRSHHPERLADELSQQLNLPAQRVFAKREVIVQGPAMATWLNREIAQKNGVSALIDFVYPRAHVQKLLQQASASHVYDEYSAIRMTWALMQIIDEEGEQLGLPLPADSSPVRRFRFCRAVADCFDQYLTFRTDMLSAWSSGWGSSGTQSPEIPGSPNQSELGSMPEFSPEELWQPKLWAKVEEKLGTNHLARLESEVLNNLLNGQLSCSTELLSVYSLSSIPPQYMRIIAASSRFRPVDIYLLNPCREYWFDRDEALTTEAPGGSLLEKFGQVGAETQSGWLHTFERLKLPYHEIDLYEDFARDSLLSSIQSDITSLEPKGAEPRHLVSKQDRSIQIHQCHSKQRQLEVLKDRIYEELLNDCSLKPDDFLVLLPKVDDYVEEIHSVFASDQKRQRATNETAVHDSTRTSAQQLPSLPYDISDRSLVADSLNLDAFIRLLKATKTTRSSTVLLNLLELAPVRSKFSLDTDDLSRIRQWLVDTEIRWGLDQNDREAIALTGSTNTWKEGLLRLLLGFSTSSKQIQLYRDIVPYEGYALSDRTLLNSLCLFIDQFERLCDYCSKIHPLEEWANKLFQFYSDFVTTSQESEWQSELLRKQLITTASFCPEENAELDIVLTSVSEALESSLPGRGFLGGGVHFSALVPMRTVPFKFIAIIGLEEASFPREQSRPPFDWLEKQRRAGDRSRYLDDIYLFLESLLCARNGFWLFYNGRSLQKNRELPPSSVVDEIRNYIAQNYCCTEEMRHFALSSQERKEGIFCDFKHRLQSFHPEYFNGTLPRGYNYLSYECAKLIHQPRSNESCFIDARLTPPKELDVDAQLMVELLSNPCDGYRTQSLNLSKRYSDAIPSPLLAVKAESNLANYRIAKRVNSWLHTGVPIEKLQFLLRGTSSIAEGQLGNSYIKSLTLLSDDYFKRRCAIINGGTIDKRSSQFISSFGWRLNATYDVVSNGTESTFGFMSIFGRAKIRALIEAEILVNLGNLDEGISHFILQSSGLKPKEDQQLILYPAKDPAARLEQLMRLYYEGRCAPLPSVEESSQKFVKNVFAKLKLTIGQSEEFHLDNYEEHASALLEAARSDINQALAKQDPNPSRLFAKKHIPNIQELERLSPHSTLSFSEFSLALYAPINFTNWEDS